MLLQPPLQTSEPHVVFVAFMLGTAEVIQVRISAIGTERGLSILNGRLRNNSNSAKAFAVVSDVVSVCLLQNTKVFELFVDCPLSTTRQALLLEVRSRLACHDQRALINPQ